jgi:hypothetical protein
MTNDEMTNDEMTNDEMTSAPACGERRWRLVGPRPRKTQETAPNGKPLHVPNCKRKGLPFGAFSILSVRLLPVA